MVKVIVNKKTVGFFPIGTKFKDIHDKLEKAGVEFGCTDGQCGVCVGTIVKGLDNLNEISEQESETLWRIGEYEEDRRLLCQLEITREDEEEIIIETD